MSDEHYRRLEAMYLGAPINTQFFLPTISIAEGSAEINMPLTTAHHHAAGSAHGAVLFKMVDDAAFFAAQSLVTDRFVVTSDLQIRFVRPGLTGTLKAVGRVKHASRRVVLAEADVFDEDGRLLATGTGSFMTSRVLLKDVPAYYGPIT